MASYGQQQQQQQWYAGGPAAGAAGAYAAPVGMTGITPGSNYYGQGMTGGTSMSGGGGDVGVGQWGGSMDSVGVEEDYSMEPPLLEELGINFRHIGEKTKTVLMPMRSMDEHIMDDADLAGPLFFLLCFGIFLLLTGKVHFGYIYGFGVSGCLAMYLVLNLLVSCTGAEGGREWKRKRGRIDYIRYILIILRHNVNSPCLNYHVSINLTALTPHFLPLSLPLPRPHSLPPFPPYFPPYFPPFPQSVKEIDIWRVCSILGYGLLPVIVLSFLGIAVSLKGPVGQGIATFTIAWSTYSSTRLFEKALNMSQQRYLVAYPVALVYAIFVLITVF